MLIHTIIIVLCMAAGFYYQTHSKEIDAVGEQVAERILDSEGIDVDFSAKKKIEKTKGKDDIKKE